MASSDRAFRDSEFPVFADTSLGTHIAISISPNITAATFARELESEHLNCFPIVGEIIINKLMVKRRSCFYCLPESISMKYAFQGVKKTRFIYIEVCALNSFKKTCLSDCKCRQIVGHKFVDADVTEKEMSDILPDRIADKHREETSTYSQVEIPSDMLSVSNIIDKYFTNQDEVSSKSETNPGTNGKMFSQQLKATTNGNGSNVTITTTPPRRVTVFPYCPQPRSLISINRSKGTKVGKNIVLALSKLGISAYNQNTSSSISRLRHRKISRQNSRSLVKNLVFEISDDNV